MNVKTADIKELESYYEKSGNQLVVLYGRKDCKKEELIREFVKDKKFFYYRCRQASAQDQLRMMGKEIISMMFVYRKKHMMSFLIVSKVETVPSLLW